MVRREREISEEVQHRSYPDKPASYNSPPTVPPRGRLMPFGKIRPQIFLAILCLTILAVIAVFNGMPEISTATIGGIIALGMKLLEAE